MNRQAVDDETAGVETRPRLLPSSEGYGKPDSESASASCMSLTVPKSTTSIRNFWVLYFGTWLLWILTATLNKTQDFNMRKATRTYISLPDGDERLSSKIPSEMGVNNTTSNHFEMSNATPTQPWWFPNQP